MGQTAEPNGRGPRRRSRLWIPLATLVITFAVLEAGWRVYLSKFASDVKLVKYARLENVPDHLMRYEPHPYLSYALNPDFVRNEGRNRHNELGFRGPEVEREKPPGTFRVACIGGSTTYDIEIDDDALTFAAQLEEVLHDVYDLDQVEVINAGVGGYNSWESLLNLQLRVLDLDPDLVVVYHATNDMNCRLVDPEAYRRDNTGRRHHWFAQSRWWDRSAIIRYFGVQWGFSQRNTLGGLTDVPPPRDMDGDALLDANPPVYFRANLEAIVALCEASGVQVVLTSWAHSDEKGDYAADPVSQRAFREHNEVSREVAAALDVPFFDFAPSMPMDAELWADGVHNNEAGARKKAELFAEFLAPLVR